MLFDVAFCVFSYPQAYKNHLHLRTSVIWSDVRPNTFQCSAVMCLPFLICLSSSSSSFLYTCGLVHLITPFEDFCCSSRNES